MYRLIDHLEKENVVMSPLIKFEQMFERIEQEWQQKQMFPFRANQKDYLAVQTQKPVLNLEDSSRPKGMQMFCCGEKLVARWEVKKMEKVITPASYKQHRQEITTIVLSQDEYFVSRDILFPGGKVLLEISARSRRMAEYLPVLRLYLNDKLMGEFPVGRNQEYSLVCEVPFGRYALKLGFSEVVELNPCQSEEEVLVDTIRITPDKDLILIPRRAEDDKSGEEKKYRAVYFARPTSRILHLDSKAGRSPEGHRSQLRTNAVIEKEITLHSGTGIFEIICYSQPKGSVLSLWLDDKKIGQSWIYPWLWRSYAFEVNTERGKHRLRLKFFKPKSMESSLPDCQLHIHRMIVKEHERLPLVETLEGRERFAIEDLGLGENPYSIKNKFISGGYSLNALFAPPKSRFRFSLRIPEAGILEFGFGLLREQYGHLGDGVTFKIVVQDKGKENILFSKDLDIGEPDKGIIFREEKIDLSEYKNQRVHLDFVTEGRTNLMNDLSFWYNPVIHTKSGTNGKQEDFANVLLISLDSVRADHLGCYGYGRDTSPWIDRLAQDSVLFENCYSQAPYTITSHMSLLTALYPARHQLYTMFFKLDSSVVTIADIFRVNGYFTGAFTGGGQVSGAFGFSRGFDFYNERRGNIQSEENLPVISDLARDWLRENKAKKFFLFLHTYQPHDPYSPPAPYNSLFLDDSARWKEIFLASLLNGRKRNFLSLPQKDKENIIALYDGEIRYTDEAFIKSLIEDLKAQDLYDRTMIILTSDHGQEFYEHGAWLHGHSLYNELIHVPLLIKFPRSKYGGQRVTNIVRSIDVVPTILEELGIKFSGYTLDGRSLISIAEGREKNDRVFFSELNGFPHIPAKTSTNKGSYKFILNRMYTDEEYSFYDPPPPHLDEVELFDLTGDPGEKKNIADSNRPVSQELLARIIKYLEALERGERKDKKSIIDKELQERLKALGYIR